MIPKPLSTRDYWENMYLRQRNLIRPSPHIHSFYFECDRLFRKYLPKHKGLKLLEIGCGNSIWLPYFCKNFGYEVYGIDYSLQGCELARLNLEKAGCKGTIFCCDIFSLKEKYNYQFDIAISFGMIEHFDEPAEVLKIFSNFLKVGGMLITIAPNLLGTIGKIQNFIDEDILEMHKIFDLESLRTIYSQIGLKCIRSLFFAPFDMGMLNFSKFPLIVRRLVGGIIVFLNLPILYLGKLFNLNFSSQKLCSYMIIIGIKER